MRTIEPINWFEADDPAQSLLEHVEDIERNQGWVRDSIKSFAKAYSRRDELWFDSSLRARSFQARQTKRNAIKGAVDTAASIITQNKPRVRAQVRDGDWDDHSQARKIEQMLLGEFIHCNIYAKTLDMLLDALKFGLGALKICFDPTSNRAFPERVLPGDLIVDEQQVTPDRDPLEVFHRRRVDKYVLASQFPKYKNQIFSASSERSEWADSPVVSGQVIVVEAWRLPLGDTYKGRHVIAVDGCTLFEEEWEYDWFPFVFHRWTVPTTGFYGQGVIEEILPLQIRLDELDYRIGLIEDKAAVFRTFIEAGSDISKPQIDDRIGAVITYRGAPPIFHPGVAPLQELYAERANVARSILEEVGLSQYSAHALKPAGLESAVALREFDNIQNQRFVNNHTEFDRVHVEVAWRMLEVYACNFEKYDPPEGLLSEIEWDRIGRTTSRFSLELAPASIFSETPAARRQTVVELAQVGQLNKQEILYLLDHPDLEHANKLTYADHEAAEKIISMLSKGEYVAPESSFDLPLMMNRVRQASIKAFTLNASPEILSNFRTWLAQAEHLLKQSVPPPPPMPMAPPGAPGMDPMGADMGGPPTMAGPQALPMGGPDMMPPTM